ncbi:MAG: Fpg/Nei family DNA glycosylase [Nigerium sp.]|nr:Fpg/Nei family DNA glycosylase [Nigerium sp.]
MPEGHVIHRLARTLTESFGGRPVGVSSPQGRFADEAQMLDGQTLEHADAVGKHLLIDFEPGTVWIHLGLIGKLLFNDQFPPPYPGTLRLRIDDGEAAADLRGPQWCRLVTPAQRAAVVDASGPDPLRTDADPVGAWRVASRTRRPIAAVLMDQKAFAGVGNIFRAEVLYRHHLDPYLPAAELPREVFDAVWSDLVALMHAALGVGRIDTVADAHSPEATGRPARVDRHGGEVYVYRRAGLPCHVCGTPIARADLAGRHLYWCPVCQPAGSRGAVRS